MLATDSTLDPSAPSPWMTRQQVRERLQLGDTVVQKAVNSGRLRAFKVAGGRRQRFHVADVDAFMRGEVPAAIATR